MELDVEASPHAAQPWFVLQLQRQKVTAAVANNLGAGRISYCLAGGEAEAAKSKGWQSGSPGQFGTVGAREQRVALRISHRCIAQFSLLQCGRERIMLSKGKNERRCRNE